MHKTTQALNREISTSGSPPHEETITNKQKKAVRKIRSQFTNYDNQITTNEKVISSDCGSTEPLSSHTQSQKMMRTFQKQSYTARKLGKN